MMLTPVTGILLRISSMKGKSLLTSASVFPSHLANSTVKRQRESAMIYSLATISTVSLKKTSRR
nr:MAG TPA: hypothetical protein [Caudoviricetes sp.]